MQYGHAYESNLLLALPQCMAVRLALRLSLNISLRLAAKHGGQACSNCNVY